MLLGPGASGDEHTDLNPLREHRGSSAHRRAKQPLQGAIPPPSVCVCFAFAKALPAALLAAAGTGTGKPPPRVKQGGLCAPLSSPGAEELLCQTTISQPERAANIHSLHGLFVSSVFEMQREILKLQEQNASYTEEILESSFANNLAFLRSSAGKGFLMGHEENWRRSLEEEITIIKSNNANLMMRMNNITLVAGMALHAGSAVRRPGSSASLAGLKTRFR